jgi:CelD/BcsL family acetyltransferase involved in cellulose biosynthesis
VEEVCRRRDAMLHRASQLDDPRSGPFFRAVILDHAGRGEVELTILRLDGEVAAYCLCFVDKGSYRMWNCRFAPAWAHLSPGRVTNNEAILHALADPACSEFDWMLGDESYKSGVQNHMDTSQNLLAWSSATVRAVLDAPRSVLQAMKEVKDRHEPLERAWENTKRARERMRSRARQAARRSRKLPF